MFKVKVTKIVQFISAAIIMIVIPNQISNNHSTKIKVTVLERA